MEGMNDDHESPTRNLDCGITVGGQVETRSITGAERERDAIIGSSHIYHGAPMQQVQAETKRHITISHTLNHKTS